jgi:hypothetical protein
MQYVVNENERGEQGDDAKQGVGVVPQVIRSRATNGCDQVLPHRIIGLVVAHGSLQKQDNETCENKHGQGIKNSFHTELISL